MASLCKNCGAKIVFDPGSKMLVCDFCGSRFSPEEVEAEDKAHVLDKEAVSMKDIFGSSDEKLLNCYVYTCNSCGGEIIINGTEASTKCIYCGNSAVVFSRISREKRPDVIMPFAITKERALELIHEKLDKGMFIPKEIKNFKAEHIRGIYIPYWIVNADHANAVVVKGTVRNGRNSKTVYHGRAGRLKINELPLDASKLLSDESSMRLEPFNFNELREFDEDYLTGFYSNVSDINFDDLRQVVYKRADEFFGQCAMADAPSASSKEIISSKPHTTIDYKSMRYAMLPAWFVTYTHNGKHNTILVNGQTGKIVCGVPWNKALFNTLMVTTAIATTTLYTFVLYYLLPAVLSSKNSKSGNLIALLILLAVSLISTGISKLKKTTRSIELTQAQGIFNFVKKRQ